ncbi:hypothetical protein HED63_25180 [Ochrobactrum cytisi]|nr:hypothetical protein [Brucella cytisi]
MNNRGTLTNGLVATDNDSFRLNNNGLIDGNIQLYGGGNNVIINRKTVLSRTVSQVRGFERYRNKPGVFAGSIALGAGNDDLQLVAGTVQTSVDMGPVTITSSGSWGISRLPFKWAKAMM